jgi:hypothetical protein
MQYQRQNPPRLCLATKRGQKRLQAKWIKQMNCPRVPLDGTIELETTQPLCWYNRFCIVEDYVRTRRLGATIGK